MVDFKKLLEKLRSEPLIEEPSEVSRLSEASLRKAMELKEAIKRREQQLERQALIGQLGGIPAPQDITTGMIGPFPYVTSATVPAGTIYYTSSGTVTIPTTHFIGPPHLQMSDVTEKGQQAQMTKFECWQLVDAILAHSPRTLLWGPPATGKTTTPIRLFEKQGRKVYTITITQDTSASDLLGRYVLKGGDMIWQDGPVALWWKTEGSAIVVNEIDLAGGDLNGLLHGAFDDAEIARLTLPNGEELRPSGGQVAVATMNGSPEELLPAIISRFPVTIEIDKVNPEAVKRLPADLQSLAAHAAVTKDEGRRVDIRAFYEFASLRQRISPEMAASAVFGLRADELLTAIKVGKATK
jgi:hypothetical protein